MKKLFLIQNKIGKIENIEHMTELEMLELGSNRVRVSGGNVVLYLLYLYRQTSLLVN